MATPRITNGQMIRNPAKAVLRARIKNTLKEMSTENKQLQSKVILQKVSEVEPLAHSSRDNCPSP